MTTVVITGADHPTGLGTARALAGRGYRLVGLYRQDTPCCRSKYWDTLVPVGEYSEIVDLLVRLGRESQEKAVLLMTQDNVVKLVSDHRDRLRPYYLFQLPDPEIIDTFLDKTRFHAWALKHGYTVPASYVCDSEAELARCLDEIRFPITIKPFEKTEQWEKFSPVHKILHLNNRDEFTGLPFKLFDAAPRVLVQQWIPGGDRNVYFCLVYYDHQGRKIADFTGRKLFQWPPLCGSTAAAIGTDDTVVAHVTEQIFNQVGYQGLGSLEFKRSDADGQYYIIEPTVGRNDLQSNIALAGGVNLTAFAVAGAEGKPFPESKKRGAAWIHEEGLLDSLRALTTQHCRRRSDLLQLFKPHIAFAYMAIRDMAPARSLWGGKLARIKKRWRT